MGSARIGVAGLVLVVAGAAGLAIGMQADDAPVRLEGEGSAVGATTGATGPTLAEAPPSEDLRRWNRPALPPVPAPPGKRMIAFDDGGMPGLAGYVEDEGPHGWDQLDPVLELGSGRYEVRGEEVTDLDGVLLGYVISTIGLVDLETALDAEALDALLAKAEAQREAQPEMTEEEIAEKYGIEVDVGEGQGDAARRRAGRWPRRGR